MEARFSATHYRCICRHNEISVNWAEVSILEGLQIIQTVSNSRNDHAIATFIKFLVDLSKLKNGESIFYWLILEQLSDVIINTTNSKQRKRILEILTQLVQVIPTESMRHSLFLV